MTSIQLRPDTSNVGDRNDLILSIRPQYADKIITGEKTVELRKRFPKGLQQGTKIVIYATKPVGAIIGYAAIECVHEGKIEDVWAQFADQACITKNDFDIYYSGAAKACAIQLRDVRKFKTSIFVDELAVRYEFVPPQSYCYVPDGMYELIQDGQS